MNLEYNFSDEKVIEAHPNIAIDINKRRYTAIVVLTDKNLLIFTKIPDFSNAYLGNPNFERGDYQLYISVDRAGIIHSTTEYDTLITHKKAEIVLYDILLNF